MRNWNTAGVAYGGRFAGFQPTMRNWNDYVAIAQTYPNPFQPTYEELKLWYVSVEIGHFTSFQPTYEELKHVYNKIGERKRKVFSLPMRNWNSSKTASGITTITAFSAYLWGIETKQKGRRSSRKEVFSLPMRNWNYSGGVLFGWPPFSAYLWGIERSMGWVTISKPLSFQPTYEVKQIFSTAATTISIQFSAYLWELKLGRIPNPDEPILSFSAYLWGIEPAKRIFRPLPHGFQPTYEELKHFSRVTGERHG